MLKIERGVDNLLLNVGDIIHQPTKEREPLIIMMRPDCSYGLLGLADGCERTDNFDSLSDMSDTLKRAGFRRVDATLTIH
jgi:hypothetical protein